MVWGESNPINIDYTVNILIVNIRFNKSLGNTDTALHFMDG